MALLALICLCAGAKVYRRSTAMSENFDPEHATLEPMPFRFLYNMQMTSGLVAPSDEDATVRQNNIKITNE